MASALLFGCGPAAPALTPAPDPTRISAATLPTRGAVELTQGKTRDASASEAEPPLKCGALACLAFESELQAFEHVLLAGPTILAVGEAHALGQAPSVRSATARFRDELLPRLKGRATSLVVELLAPDPKCRPVTDSVREQHKEATEKQRPTDQNEFVALGHRAKELGIVPFILRPTCPEYQRLLDAGPELMSETLGLIARLTEERVRVLFAETARVRPGQMVVTYGGALHNDARPRPGFAGFSFGPGLAALAAPRYVEVDLIVPEFIKDTEVWRKQPWYGAYDRLAHPDRARLFTLAANSYVIIFPESAAERPAAPGNAQQPSPK